MMNGKHSKVICTNILGNGSFGWMCNDYSFCLMVFSKLDLENSSFGYHEWKIVLYWRSVEILSTKTPRSLSFIVNIWKLTFVNENILLDVILFYLLITNILLIYGNSSHSSTFFWTLLIVHLPSCVCVIDPCPLLLLLY